MEILCFKCKGNWDLTHGGDGSKCLGRGNHQQRSEKLCLEKFLCRLSLSLVVLEGQFVSQASCYLARHSVGRNKGFFTQIELFNHHHRVVLRELAQGTMAAAQAELCSGEWDFLDTIKKLPVALSGRVSRAASQERSCILSLVDELKCVILACLESGEAVSVFPPFLAQQPLFLSRCNVELCNQGYPELFK